ncbi:hypothetical protein M2262_004319 [Pseudomonas sp. BIGb0408]|uniref:Uncharacterized protein n=1 Tax=Phytopseudomonas flavescens TaxID=29435 RepID=A0A7Y9XUR0_9GAMM|nr:hypothetical protein [Pseudomonas sp. BIGb0408]NYH76457.1 hypothetical protein [Pseudomonas flavescens]
MSLNQHCWQPVGWMTFFSSTMNNMQRWMGEASATRPGSPTKVEAQP